MDQNANELWTVLVCKPWLDGEFGTTVYTTGKGAKPTVVNQYGRQLLWAQAIAANENATPSLITAKENTYAGIAAAIKQNDPAVYSLFQGNQYPTRLEIAFAALFAALVAGVLVLLIAITLIILKLGFLLLLVAGPFFLIVGTHPGFGRVVALRWFEMLIGVLLKQAAIALVLSVLLYAYSLIMGTSDATLPWALKILMIALVTVAVFIYRKPFVHLFSAVGYGMVGSRDRSDTELARAGNAARRNTVDAATVGVPGFAAYRAARWARRNPAQAAGVAAQVAVAGGAGAAAGRRPARPPGPARTGPRADQPAPRGRDQSDEAYQSASGRAGLSARGRGRATPGGDTEPSRRTAAGPARPGRHRRARRPRAGPGPAPAAPVPAGPGPAGRPGRRPARRPLPAAPASSGGPAGRGRRRTASTRQRWPGAAPRPPAAARAAVQRRQPAVRQPSPAVRSGRRRRGPAAAPAQPSGLSAAWFGAPSRGGPPPRTAEPGAAARAPGRPAARRAVPARPAGRTAAPARRRAPVHRRRQRCWPARGGAAGGQRQRRADGSPPGPFWLRPVRRKK